MTKKQQERLRRAHDTLMKQLAAWIRKESVTARNRLRRDGVTYILMLKEEKEASHD